MRSRFTSASALWKMRISRRSSGWSTIEAIVDRNRAGEGLRGFAPIGLARRRAPMRGDGFDPQQRSFI